jgi:hypothetical protein
MLKCIKGYVVVIKQPQVLVAAFFKALTSFLKNCAYFWFRRRSWQVLGCCLGDGCAARCVYGSQCGVAYVE